MKRYSDTKHVSEKNQNLIWNKKILSEVKQMDKGIKLYGIKDNQYFKDT